MKLDITDPKPPPGPLWRRVAWFVAIWASSVAALGLVALAIRQVLT